MSQNLKNNTIYLLVKSCRPKQWIKNVSIYAALLFSGFLFLTPANSDVPYFFTVSYAFFIFCLLTSAVYIFNDIIDYQADRNHPFKKKRPIASGKLPVWIAAFTAITLLFVVFFLSLYLSIFFQLLLFAYLGFQIFYSKVAKHIPIFDVVLIATGFLIRVYAGAVVVNLHMSVWFLLTVVSASLFLAVGKRQSERTLLSGQELGETRNALKRYSQRLLDQYTGMFANATWLTYALFTFQNEFVRPSGSIGWFYTFLPRALQSEKLLMLTLPFVIFGVMRYLLLVYEDNKGESPEVVLLRDKPLLATVFWFGVAVIVIIYGPAVTG